jgi:hypothetical protein
MQRMHVREMHIVSNHPYLGQLALLSPHAAGLNKKIALKNSEVYINS